MTNPFGHNPFEPNAFHGGPVGVQPPPAPVRDEVNVLATLSVVFAFVFAPVGAILGHLALAQIHQTGERGRDRALVGVTLSYVLITVAVVALIVGSTLTDDAPARIAASTTTTASAATTTTTAPPPPPPTVAPADLDGLLPSLEQIKNTTGDSNLKAEDPMRKLEPLDPKAGSYDRPECVGAVAAGVAEEYSVPVQGFVMTGDFDLADARNPRGSVQAVAAFRDATEARTQLANLQSAFTRCGNSTVNLTYADTGRKVPFSIASPADAGNGIIVLVVSASSVNFVRAIAAKANVFIEIRESSVAADRARQAALDIVNYILGKIPG
jgi:eukaryotic-like serine/threonine-protein kinase